MSFPELTKDSGWGEEGDDESDFGEFSSASPKSDGFAMSNHPTPATVPSTLSTSDILSQPARSVRCTGINLCGELRPREPNGYITGQRILSAEDCKGVKTAEHLYIDSQFEISDLCMGELQTISGARGREIRVGHPELFFTSQESVTSGSILISDADVPNCRSASAGRFRTTPACPNAEKSSRRVDRLSVLSGSELIGSVQSNSGRARPGCNLKDSVSWQDSCCSSVPNAELSLPVDIQINSENSCTHAECICETGEFDDFQSVLQTDDFQERVKPVGKQSCSWASFGDGGVCGESWLAFQDNDLESGTLDDPRASQTVDSQPTVIPPSCADDTEEWSNSFSQSEKNVRKFVELVFPTSANTTLSGDEKPSLISGTSRGSGTFNSDLLDLIGERPVKGDPKWLSGVIGRSSSSADVWNSLKVMEDTAALKFHWNGSRSNRLLLKSVAMESPTRLNARRIQKLPAARTVQEMPEHKAPTSAAATCRQPYESSFSQTVLSVTHLRM